MNGQYINITVLGLNVAFRPGADVDRAKRAANLLEERYACQKAGYKGRQSKDVFLTFLALGLADELLQMKTKQDRTESSIRALVEKIGKSL